MSTNMQFPSCFKPEIKPESFLRKQEVVVIYSGVFLVAKANLSLGGVKPGLLQHRRQNATANANGGLKHTWLVCI